MDKSAAAAYVYAKASGMLARSFIGPNVSKLFSVKTLSELWSLLFDSEVPTIPEVLLAHQIEIDAEKKFINQYIKLLSNYSNPDDVLVSLLKFYEYENVKQLGAALCFKETELPHIIDIGKYNSLDFNAWPDLAKITANSSISWYNKIPSIQE
ncbi:MAG: hypothetical protein K6F69_10290, partial [Treponema sp.]|nr:hypothetical protein [Treponema sp.]